MSDARHLGQGYDSLLEPLLVVPPGWNEEQALQLRTIVRAIVAEEQRAASVAGTPSLEEEKEARGPRTTKHQGVMEGHAKHAAAAAQKAEKMVKGANSTAGEALSTASSILRTLDSGLRFNNQNTILMTRMLSPEEETVVDAHTRAAYKKALDLHTNDPEKYPHPGPEAKKRKGFRCLLLMHNSRLFYFQLRPPPPEIQAQGAAVCLDYEVQLTAAVRDVLLDIVTTKKYRVMTSVYALFRITDNVALVALVFIGLTGGNLNIVLDEPTLKIMAVLLVEVVYDVLEFVAQIWIANRLMPYVVTGLFLGYTSVFAQIGVNALVWWLLAVRAIAFLAELLVDYCIDVEMHHDLALNRIRSFAHGLAKDRNRRRDNTSNDALLSDSLLPSQAIFRGSNVSWTLVNSHHDHFARDPPMRTLVQLPPNSDSLDYEYLDEADRAKMAQELLGHAVNSTKTQDNHSIDVDDVTVTAPLVEPHHFAGAAAVVPDDACGAAEGDEEDEEDTEAPSGDSQGRKSMLYSAAKALAPATEMTINTAKNMFGIAALFLCCCCCECDNEVWLLRIPELCRKYLDCMNHLDPHIWFLAVPSMFWFIPIFVLWLGALIFIVITLIVVGILAAIFWVPAKAVRLCWECVGCKPRGDDAAEGARADVFATGCWSTYSGIWNNEFGASVFDMSILQEMQEF